MTNCSGECWECACSGGCLAGNGDDDFSMATDEQLIERLLAGKFPEYSQHMIDRLYLHRIGGVVYFEDGRTEYVRGHGTRADGTHVFITDFNTYYYGLREKCPETLFCDNVKTISIPCDRIFYTVRLTLVPSLGSVYNSINYERVVMPIKEIKIWG
jgi:hypothetical protein